MQVDRLGDDQQRQRTTGFLTVWRDRHGWLYRCVNGAWEIRIPDGWAGNPGRDWHRPQLGNGDPLLVNFGPYEAIT